MTRTVSGMIEKCARGMWCADFGVTDDGPHLDRSWGSVHAFGHSMRDSYRQRARACLTELLEPTPEMVAAAWTLIDGEKQKAGIARLGPGLGVSEIFTAMIRKAMGDGE